jgi:hypothetical protein
MSVEETVKTVEAVAEMLIEAGVHVDAVNADGLTAARFTVLSK